MLFIKWLQNKRNKSVYSTFNIPKWSSVVTAVSIPNTIAVYGNGKVLGLTDGNGFNCGLITGGANYQTGLKGAAFGQTLPYSYSGVSDNGNRTFGVTTDAVNSGLIAKSNLITRTVITKKYVIKY